VGEVVSSNGKQETETLPTGTQWARWSSASSNPRLEVGDRIVELSRRLPDLRGTVTGRAEKTGTAATRRSARAEKREEGMQTDR